MWRVLLVSASVALLAFTDGCLTPSDPSCLTPSVVVLGAESGRAYVVSDSCPSGSTLPVRLPRVIDAFAMSPDSAVLYFTGFDAAPTRYLFALDLRSLRVLWQQDLAEIAPRGAIDGLTILGNYALAVSRDKTRLVLNGERNGEPGLVSVSLETLEPLAFHGPFATPPDATASLDSSTVAPTGAIAVAGTRQTSGRPTTGMFLVLSPDLTPLDSVVLGTSADDRWGAMRQLTTSSNGEVAYISTADSVFKYSVSERRFTSRTTRPTQGWISFDPGLGRLYLTDPGDGRDTPGTGLVFVFDSELVALAPLDLRAAIGGGVPVTHSATPALNSDFVYVTAGTASRGPLYGPQPARVLVVDARSGIARRVIALNDWGSLRAFPVPR